jgi:hypothetical protein
MTLGRNLALSRHLVSALPAKFPMSVSQAFGYSPFDQLFSRKNRASRDIFYAAFLTLEDFAVLILGSIDSFSPMECSRVNMLLISGLPFLDSIRYRLSRFNLAFSETAAIPPCDSATFRRASRNSARSPSSIAALRYAAASRGSLKASMRSS